MMKKIILFFSALILISPVLWATSVNSEITGVRVYTNGAEISRKAQAQIPAGTQEIVISGLPFDIDPQSIQMKGQGNFTILSVSHRTNYLESPQLTRTMRMLRDSLEYYKNQIDIQQSLLKVYEEEESLLLANKSIGGTDTGVNVANLRAMADFFRNRLADVKKLQLDTRTNIQKLQERHNRVRNQINQTGAEQNRQVGEIVITTLADRAVRGNFEFSFITWQAGWNAVYDIRANDVNEPVELMMKASVLQFTGEDWNNIPLTLSTGDPRANFQIPMLSTWFLRFIAPMPPPPPRRESQELMIVEDEFFRVDAEDIYGAKAASVAEVAFIQETRTTTEYRIDIPFTLVSGNKPQIVEVQKNELPAGYNYFAVPKLSREAFLLAKITGWEEYVRLPGGVNVFFEGAYVGRSFLDPESTTDTLEISLGNDRGVVLERNRLTEFSRKGILGRRTTETVAWELVVRNTRNREITINIQDQIPVSTDANIQVTLEESSGAQYDESTGKLNWRINLGPSETQKRNFRYSVRYPSDKQIRLE
ncbi:MAG: DUF4139 domain-containing protein [Bacteroidales bacterium]|nr:DUF4139 domain-containing protein [Bacteroidales bacterium]